MADYNSSYTGVQIDTAVGKALTPDSTPTAESTELITSGAVKAALDGKVPVYGMGEYLLDNWYFLNPVNQRGQSSYSGAVQDTIDRWKTSNANTTISLTASGLVTSASGTSIAYLLQCLNHPNELLGKTVTLSFLTSTGLFTKTATLPASNPSATAKDFATIDNIGQILYLSGVWYVRLTSAAGSGNTYCAAKLELGTQQTLAHLEGSTWVLNEIPDYEAELIKCQTSTADPSDTYANKTLANEQQLAYVETGTTASRAYAVDDLFCLGGQLCKANTDIASGATFTLNTNYSVVDEGGLNLLNSKIYRVIYSANGTYTYSLPTGRWFLIYVNRPNSSHTGIYTAHVTGANGYLVTIFETSNFSNVVALSLSGRSLSVQVKNTYAALNIINFGGM